VFQRAQQLWPRVLSAAPLLLALSIIGRLAWDFLLPNGLNVVDLHVYVDGSATLLHHRLYDFTYTENTPDFALPFTYPPFAALVFFPLHFLPFSLVAVVWLLATVAALYAVIRICLELMLGSDARDPKWRGLAVFWTVLGMWTEPVRTTIDFGQVNVFLMLACLVAVRTRRWWWSGLLIGFAAGIKLVPAFTGLYFLARGRWAAAVCSGAVFLVTVGLSFLLIGTEANRYFGTLIGDASRIGPVGSVWNQSLRGALSRIAGHDVKSGPVWLVGIVAILVLAVLAWRGLDRDDRLGTLVIVQLFGLMASPISWMHHWVWVLPMLLWLIHGPVRIRPGMRWVAGYWLVNVIIGTAQVMSIWQVSMWLIPRPWYLAWLGGVDTFGVLLVYGWLVWSGLRRRRDRGEVAAAAIVADGKLLLAQRTRPAELAGKWELPGGKVEPGETPQDALSRELREELGVRAVVGPRLGDDVPLPGGRRVLRAYLAWIRAGVPAALDHADLRWVDADELMTLDLVPHDRVWLDDLRDLLSPAGARPAPDPS
jgi:alpha-1,2-mannosyltransferase